MSIRTALIGPDGTIGAAAVLDERVCDCCQTAGAATPEGTFVAYRDRSDAEMRDLASVRRVGEIWTPPAAVHNDSWTIRGCPMNGPQVAASGRRVALAWYTEGDGARVRVAFSEDAGAHFGAPVGYIGQGGTIPLMNMLSQGFPTAQMMVCGVLGPKSNAHGPNEFLHVPYGKKLTAAVSQVIAACP